nr:hypothetical protein [Tanacetum cinerariifolium]
MSKNGRKRVKTKEKVRKRMKTEESVKTNENETAPQVKPPKEGQPSNAQAVHAVETWKNLDFLCHNYVLNGLVDDLCNVYCKTMTAKELWESLERKYKTEDAGTKKCAGSVWGCDRLVSRAKVIENQVMAISVISVYLDSSEGSVRTHIGRVILFGTIPTTILDTTLVITLPTAHTDTTVTPIEIPIVLPTVPPLLDHTLASLNYSPASPDYSPASPDYSPASDIEHSLLDHSSLDLPSTSAGPSHKLCRSPMTPEPVLSPVSEALSLVRADLIPLPKRFKDSGYLADVEVDPKETSLRDDVMVRGINARVVVESIDREESEMGTRGPVKGRVKRVTLPMMLEDTPEPAQEERAIESKEIEAREAARKLETLNENGDEQEVKNEGNEKSGNGNRDNEGNENGGNGGNGNRGNGENGNHGMNYEGFMPM